jgi:hypothetical protein
LANCNGRMAKGSGLDRGANVGGCCINWFTFPSIPMDVD